MATLNRLFPEKGECYSFIAEEKLLFPSFFVTGKGLARPTQEGGEGVEEKEEMTSARLYYYYYYCGAPKKV